MQSSAKTPEEYIDSLSEERKETVAKLQKILIDHLPRGFKEEMAYGMLAYVVPHSLYPNGYHCDPQQPLPFISLASQKNYIALYHMGIYANAALLDWFTAEYLKYSKRKQDMGKKLYPV